MKATASQVYMATISLISGLLSNKDVNNITDEDIRAALDVAERTAEMVMDDSEAVPSDDEVVSAVKDTFAMLSTRTATKTQLLNGIMLKVNARRKIAEYIIGRAVTIGLINPDVSGTKTIYTHA